MLLSIVVHLIVLIHLASIYHPNVVSRIELTLQSIKSRPQPKIEAPPARQEQLQNFYEHQPPPIETRNPAILTAPQYQQPKPIQAERLEKIGSGPQIPDISDPVATVWEEPPEAQQVSVAPGPASIKPDTGLDQKQFIAEIIQQIDDAKEYPPRARRRNLQGVVKVLFTIGGRGELVSITVSTSSGSRILDRSAIKAVQKAAPFGAPPNGAVTLELPIKYQLTQLN